MQTPKLSKLKSLIISTFFSIFDIHQNKQIILAGDFNLFLDTTLEAEVGSSCLKKEICSKIN